MEPIDDREFIVTLNKYDNNWKDLFTFIFPSTILQEKSISELFFEDIFGCGPYKLKEWIKGNHIILEENECFSGEKPEIDAIKFIFNSDINYLISMLKEGNIDILSIPSDLDLMNSVEEDKDLGLIVEQGYLWEHLAISLKPIQEQ